MLPGSGCQHRLGSDQPSAPRGVTKQRVLSGGLFPLPKTISVLLCWFGETLWVRIPRVRTPAFRGSWAVRFEGGQRGRACPCAGAVLR